MITRKTTQAERQQISDLFCIAFELPPFTDPAVLDPDTVHRWASFTDQGEMMCACCVTDFLQTFDGHSCKMGGMGGVSTLPAFRRMGGIRSCFTEALREMYTQDYDFSYLYPFSTAYYRRFGYESCVRRCRVNLDLKALPKTENRGHFLLQTARQPMTDAIRQIDTVLEQAFNMMIRHGEAAYGWTREAAPARTLEFTYVWFDEHGVPGAYTTFRPQKQADGRNLVCSRFAFLSRAGFEGLLSVFRSLSADHDRAKFTLPALPSLSYLLPEWSLTGAPSFTLHPAGMVRAVNAVSVLRKARYRGSGSAVLALTDPMILENTGSFAVTFRDGQCVSVDRTDAEPDVRLTIAAFSALIAGAAPFDQAARWMEGIEVLHPDGPLDRMFYAKPMMILDDF